MFDIALLTDPKALIGGAILAAVALIFIGRKVHNSKAGRIANKLVGPVMFVGMIWSADAVWELTGPEHLDLPTPLRAAMFAVLEFALLVAMLRAKDSMDRLGYTGKHGGTAWSIAAAIALFGFILGFYEGGLVVAAFRPLIPLVLTKLWWDGVLGDSERKAGKFKWTPRNLLILLGAIDADERDVKTVNRDRLIQRMTDLYYATLYGPKEKQGKVKAKLAKLTLDADDTAIQDVIAKVRRTGWVNAEPLAYAPGDPISDELAQQIAELVAQRFAEPQEPNTRAFARHDAHVAIPPTRRAKPSAQAVTSGYADGDDAATRAAKLAITGMASNRQAAEKFGVSEGTVRNRRKALEGATAQDDDAQTKTNGHAVMAGQDQ